MGRYNGVWPKLGAADFRLDRAAQLLLQPNVLRQPPPLQVLEEETLLLWLKLLGYVVRAPRPNGHGLFDFQFS